LNDEIPKGVSGSIERVIVTPLRTGLDVLEYEIRQEQAATIGRLAQDLRDALDALDAFNRRASGGKTAADSRDPQRARLVGELILGAQAMDRGMNRISPQKHCYF
jgi:hypothetical protein